MKENKDLMVIDQINENVDTLKNKKSKLYFFVFDSYGVPNSHLAYIYEIAKTYKDKGYDVSMLYQLQGEYTEAELHKRRKSGKSIDNERIFFGVEKWLGKEYSNIPHINVAHYEWKVSPSDILFIPEITSSFMFQTHQYKAKCKRVVILQDFSRVTDFIPVGVEWSDYGIFDVIAKTERQAELIKSVFPYVKVQVLEPLISKKFDYNNEPKKLNVSVISKNQRIINQIVKNFYWKYPIYKFVSFSDLRNLNIDTYASKLKESVITVWVDDETTFGSSALEAIKANNILIGKLPNDVPSWMKNGNGDMRDCAVWTYDINTIPDILSNVIGAWMQDEIPDELYSSMNEVKGIYNEEKWNTNSILTLDKIVEEHINSLESVKKSIEDKLEKEKVEE